ncbi:hypothetical protein FF011L_18170 [Roseimaritima multifibrata]|uniref:Uncharacterized protein n=1 Tax=Roseimaritima multifibrata TaxID=1930274 RepID=A0A517MDU8_9BACT|nr:hypothetical protein [Roseimaritima multifibrata]QDS93062.1 hypothetical protein FF011L_18170 [Roseimaritima multifibrata]
MWQITEPGRASCELPANHLSLSLDAADQSGVVSMQVQHADDRLEVLLADATGERLPEVSDDYARQDNYVVRLTESENDKFGVTLQSRVAPLENGLTAFEWVLATQTRLLDSHPALSLSFSDCKFEERGPGDVLLHSNGQCYSVLMSRSDQAISTWTDEADCKLQIFGDFLEKGVIQKFRVWVVAWGTKVPGREETQWVLQQLADAPLPLTT